MGKTTTRVLIGLVLGLIVSLVVLGDDGPGLEFKHILMALLGAVVGGLTRPTLARRPKG